MKKYKKILSLGLAVILGISIIGCGSSSKDTNSSAGGEGEKYELKLGHIQPADHPNGLGAEKFAELVKEKTNGNVTITVMPASQLGSEKEQFDAVDMGALDFTILGFGEPEKKYKDIGILDAPYLAQDRDQMVKILKSDVVKNMFDKMPESMGVKGLGGFYYGARYLTTSNKEVRTPADMKGLNIRVPDQKLYIDTIGDMGATATPMSFSEVYLSLQQGVIDGQENPLATIEANKFNQVQKYLIKTEHIIGANAIYESTATIEKLPEEYQTAIEEAAVETCDFINEKAFALEDEYLEKLQNEGMTLIEDVDKEAFQKATLKVYDDFDADLVKEIKEVK